ncbi:MAG: alpha/beta fold hydrolase [Cyanobacteria bacterium J06600_6]
MVRNRQLGNYFKGLLILAIAYSGSCLWLYLRQSTILYQPNHKISPSTPEDFQLSYQNVWLDVPSDSAQIHSWWFKAPTQPVIAVAKEPVNILTTPKTMLYFCGRGGSKTHYNSLARIKGFQQLGFSVLAIDYRGYGLSEGELPNESRLYQDSQAAWDYLTNQRQIDPQEIVIYGESLGGAVAIDLATKHSEAAGLIVQSSFTTMPTQVKELYPILSIFPLQLILHQRFDSINKVKQLSLPVLFIHGTADQIVNYKMSGELYDAAPEPKTLFYIPGAKHLRLYQPEHSYLAAIQDFVLKLAVRDN